MSRHSILSRSFSPFFPPRRRVVFRLLALLLALGTPLGCGGGGSAPPGGVSPIPEATILTPADGRRFNEGESIPLSGSGMDSADGALSGASMVWTSSLDGQIGAGASLAFDGASVGEHILTLTVTDSDGHADTRSIRITVGNAAPEITLRSPADGARLPADSPVLLDAEAVDPEDGPLPDDAYVWTSDREGALGTGASLTAGGLSGAHRITLTVTDSDGAETSQAVTIQVGEDFPRVSIQSPASGAILDPGETVVFRGEGEGETEGRLTGDALQWVSNRDGLLGTGVMITVDTLSEGSHIITLTATDAEGATAEDTIDISLGNTPPVVRIRNPLNGTAVPEGAFLSFEGEAEDLEDGVLPGQALNWISDRDGPLGSGNVLTTVALRPGRHVVTLRAEDVEGAAGEATVEILVGNAPPEVEILRPDREETGRFEIGEIIFFEALASDVETGLLPDADIAWASDVDGALGFGAEITARFLTAGVRNITVTGTDLEGLVDTDTLAISVGNAPPQVEITQPAPNTTFGSGDFLTFEGLARDAEDGVLIGDSLKWTSNINGPFGTGSPVTTNELRPGRHNITLTAEDTEGATASIAIPLTISAAAPPTVDIQSPADGGTFPSNASIEFRGTAADQGGTRLGGPSLVWTWARGGDTGELGTGETLTVNDLPKGAYVVTLTATDGRGVSGVDTVSLFVGNQPPSATISAPATETQFDLGNTVVFSGLAEDPEDGSLTGESLVWRSSIDGDLGTGQTITVPTLGAGLVRLSEGRHRITLTASDSQELSSTAEIAIIVGNLPPEAEIANPETGSRFDENNFVVLTGRGKDPEEGALPGDSLSWTSSIDGELGDGATLTLNTLSRGRHLVTLLAEDAEGGVGTDDIVIFIGNAEPVASITSPPPSGGEASRTFNENEPVEFAGAGLDEEDGELSEGRLTWTAVSENTGEEIFLGAGRRFQTERLTAGSWIVTLEVIDSAGDTDTAEVSVIINRLPEAIITTPMPGDQFVAGVDEIRFRGVAEDAEDPLDALEIKWTSDAAGQLRLIPGEDPLDFARDAADFAVGNHQITLEVTDGDGAARTDVVLIEILEE
ncbi:MAG: hypothetical protein ACLFQQ_04990 [Desulfococcaceae bacterium]